MVISAAVAGLVAIAIVAITPSARMPILLRMSSSPRFLYPQSLGPGRSEGNRSSLAVRPGLGHVADEEIGHGSGRGRDEQEGIAVAQRLREQSEQDRADRGAALAGEAVEAEEGAARLGRRHIGADRLDRAAGQRLQTNA